MKWTLLLLMAALVLGSPYGPGLLAQEREAPSKAKEDPAEEGEKQATEADLKAYIAKLSAEDFKTREEFSRKLLLEGKRVIPMLKEALKKDEIKEPYRWRGELIIERLNAGPVKQVPKKGKKRKKKPGEKVEGKPGSVIFTLDPVTGKLKPMGGGKNGDIDPDMLKAIQEQIRKLMEGKIKPGEMPFPGFPGGGKEEKKSDKPHKRLLTDHDGSDEF
ncbi:MAG: hypothetical protein ACYTHM_04945 [Planctomycetota bacterium]|jgi:hypothetical protein